jgi:uncharacterized protein (UPF0333 family)
MQKGQAVIEFILLILIIVVYLVSVTMPMVESTQGVIQDTKNITSANNESQKIINSINEINLFGNESKQTLILFIPNNTTIDCNNTKGITFKTQFTQAPFPADCNNGLCTKTFSTSAPLNCILKEIKGPQKISVLIQKIDNKINFLMSE